MTYQAILEGGHDEGHVEGLHRMILRLGRRRIGDADETVRQRIEAIRDIGVSEKDRKAKRDMQTLETERRTSKVRSDTAAQVGKQSAQTRNDTDRYLGPVLTGSHIMPAATFGRTLGLLYNTALERERVKNR